MFVDVDDLRTLFASRLSAMYRAEVPLYGDLIDIVRTTNLQHTQQSGKDLDRLSLERHGAIRLGTPHELQTMKQIFKILGMSAVGYYDLSVAGLPMHATCFRPVESTALQRNPFRVFTTLLRPELLQSDRACDLASNILEKRNIFSAKLLQLLDIAKSQGHRLVDNQVETFVAEAMLTFAWRSEAAATYDQYMFLKDEHPILADIVCFQSSHINHLTPRTVDIEASHRLMQEAGMGVKSRIEGPPKRYCPILLRQTSFLALEEKISFPKHDSTGSDNRGFVQGSHKARFGEIEERGAALTPAGRQLYDSLLKETMIQVNAATGTAQADDVDCQLAQTFARFPDDWSTLFKERLVYFKFQCGRKSGSSPGESLRKQKASNDIVHDLVAAGELQATPITYEDFLPFSAAGIFQSNLSSKAQSTFEEMVSRAGPHLSGFEESLGCSVLDANDLYAKMQKESLQLCAAALGLDAADLLA